MTFGVDFRIKEAKERAAFPEYYPDYQPPSRADEARWNLTERLAQIDRGELLHGKAKDEARAAAQAFYERTINDQFSRKY